MSANKIGYTLDPDSVTIRNGQYPGDPFDDTNGDGTYADPYKGGNRAGSCAPCIGFATNEPNPKIQDWPLLITEGVDRLPQTTQHIGGDGLGAGNQSLAAIKVIDYSQPDFDDVAGYMVADQEAVPGVAFEVANNLVNRGEKTILIGDRAWGAVPSV